MSDLIDRATVLEAFNRLKENFLARENFSSIDQFRHYQKALNNVADKIKVLPSAQPEIVRCKDCKWWMQQTNYENVPLSFGFCQSDDMWWSLYGETCEVAHIDTDADFYCGHAERRTDG